MVTSQGQVLTQALPPGTIHIQNSQVTLPGQTPASPATPHRRLIAAAAPCIPHKPSRPHFSWSASEWARLTAGGTSLFIHVTLPGLIPVRDQRFVFVVFFSIWIKFWWCNSEHSHSPGILLHPDVLWTFGTRQITDVFMSFHETL